MKRAGLLKKLLLWGAPLTWGALGMSPGIMAQAITGPDYVPSAVVAMHQAIDEAVARRDIAFLVGSLRSSNLDVRLYAVEAAGRLSKAEQIDFAVALLNDELWSVKNEKIGELVVGQERLDSSSRALLSKLSGMDLRAVSMFDATVRASIGKYLQRRGKDLPILSRPPVLDVPKKNARAGRVDGELPIVIHTPVSIDQPRRPWIVAAATLLGILAVLYIVKMKRR